MTENAKAVATVVENTITNSDMIASGALTVAAISVLLSVWTAFLQRQHMRLSVRPIAVIPVSDYENRIGVNLKNSGLGPMRITALRVIDNDGNAFESLIKCMPELEPGVLWDTFYEKADGATIEAGHKFNLLRLQGELDDMAYIRSRDKVRRALSRLKVVVEYTDLYNKKMPLSERELSWFGRHQHDHIPVK